MARYEYRVVCVGAEVAQQLTYATGAHPGEGWRETAAVPWEKDLNQFGEKGWRLRFFHPYPERAGSFVAVFERLEREAEAEHGAPAKAAPAKAPRPAPEPEPKVSLPLPAGPQHGIIQRIVLDRGYGFVHIESGGDLFFHRTALRGLDFTGLQEGQAVIVEVEEDEQHPGRQKAKLVWSPRDEVEA